MATLGFTVSGAQAPEASGDYELLPAGVYDATITQVDLRDTKAGTGNYLNVRLDIVGPSHEGRVVFGMITLRNPNDTAERIGREQLQKIAHYGNLGEISDTDQLVGARVGIKVGIRKSEEYGDRNEVKDYLAPKIGGQKASAAAPAQPSASAPAGAPPWARK